MVVAAVGGHHCLAQASFQRAGNRSKTYIRYILLYINIYKIYIITYINIYKISFEKLRQVKFFKNKLVKLFGLGWGLGNGLGRKWEEFWLKFGFGIGESKSGTNFEY